MISIFLLGMKKENKLNIKMEAEQKLKCCSSIAKQFMAELRAFYSHMFYLKKYNRILNLHWP